MNYRELYEWGRVQLMDAGVEEAELDARLLLEEIFHSDRHDLIVHGERTVTQEQAGRYRGYIGQRKTRRPLQHILGFQEFMGLIFQVSPQVLIPRQDTETLVEEALRHLHDRQSILDLCTGSGCILLSLLHYTNNCQGAGVDISREALHIAAANAKRLELSAEWIESDLFAGVADRYDMIVSNPPYIPTRVIDGLMEEVKDYEPVRALDGGEDGLDFYRRIVEQAENYLYRGGMLLMEVGLHQSETVAAWMRSAGFRQVERVKDMGGVDRVVSGVFGGNKGV